MAVPPDLFQASPTTIAGFARAAEAEFSFWDGDPDDGGSEYTLVGMQVQLSYQEQITPNVLPGGKTLIIAGMPMGQITIGALVGNELGNFLKVYGNLCQMGGEDPLWIKMSSSLDCGGELSSLDTASQIIFKCYNNKITQFGASNQIQGIVVATNIQLITLNVAIDQIGATAWADFVTSAAGAGS